MDHLGEPNYEYKIAYVPPADLYNGVLLLLREPYDNKARTSDEYLTESNKWFRDLIIGEPVNGNYETEAYGKQSVSRYGSRFREMLSFAGREKQLKLEEVMFANISFKGGKNTVGEEYWGINKKVRLVEIFSFLANYGYRTGCVFACIDLCRCISQLKGAMVYPEGGLVYSNGKRRKLIIWHDIRFYEIYHPSRSPRISNPGDSPS